MRFCILLGGLFCGVLGLCRVEASQEPGFQIAAALDFQHLSGTPDKSYIIETMGSGVALFDYDQDGDLDIFLVNASTLQRLAEGIPGEPNRLFRNDGNWEFKDVTEQAGVGDRGFGQGVAVADIDNDGDSDIYVTNYGPNVFYLNNGDGTFTEIASGAEDDRWGTSAVFGDFDRDGFVDLYVCNYLIFDREMLDRLIPRRFCEWKGIQVHCGPRGFDFASGVFYHNRGDRTFEDWTERAGVVNFETYQLGAIFSDLDLDGDQDLYVATDMTFNLLFENSGDGRFRDLSLPSGTALSQMGAEQAGMGVDVGDVNGDGRLDIFVTNYSDDYNTLYLSRGEMIFEDASDLANLVAGSLPYLGWSTRLVDLDADGDLDIFLVSGHVYPQVDGSDLGESFRQPMQLYLNRGDGTFEIANELLGSDPEPRVGRGAALGDLDGDSSQDIVVNIMDGNPVLFANRLPLRAGTVVMRLVGRNSSRDGVGALVRAELGEQMVIREVSGSRGYLSHSDDRLYLGIGSHQHVNKLTIQWPGGALDTLNDLTPGFYVVVEGVGVANPPAKLGDSPSNYPEIRIYQEGSAPSIK